MKFISKYTSLLLPLCISSVAFADLQFPSLKGGIQIFDIPGETGAENYDIGLANKVAYETALGHYISSLRVTTDEQKINSAIGLFHLDRLSLDDNEILKMYNNYKAKLDHIGANEKIGLFTDYIPSLGARTYRTYLLNSIDNVNGGMYDFTTERLYMYDTLEMEYDCKKPLVTRVPLYMKLNSCKRPYIHITKSEMKEIRDKGTENFAAISVFILENNKKIVRCPSRIDYVCIAGESMLETKVKDIFVFIQNLNGQGEPLKFKVEYE